MFNLSLCSKVVPWGIPCAGMDTHLPWYPQNPVQLTWQHSWRSYRSISEPCNWRAQHLFKAQQGYKCLKQLFRPYLTPSYIMILYESIWYLLYLIILMLGMGARAPPQTLQKCSRCRHCEGRLHPGHTGGRDGELVAVRLATPNRGTSWNQAIWKPVNHGNLHTSWKPWELWSCGNHGNRNNHPNRGKVMETVENMATLETISCSLDSCPCPPCSTDLYSSSLPLRPTSPTCLHISRPIVFMMFALFARVCSCCCFHGIYGTHANQENMEARRPWRNVTKLRQ